MFETRKRPRGRDNKRVDLLLGRQFSIHHGKAKVVADSETKMQTAERKGREGIARSKARLLFNRRDRIQMSLAIFRSDVAM